MMIMRFHKLIQSKLLWLVFLGVLVFSFVGLSFIETGAGNDRSAFLKETVARVDGRPVSRLELNRTQTLAGGPEARDADPDMLAEMALRRLARLAYADRIGIDVPREVASQQYATQIAGEDGVINEEMRTYVQRSLQSQGLSEAEYIDFLREELILDQLNRLIESYTLITPYEAERWAQTQTDAFTVLHASLDDAELVDDIQLSDEEIEAFFAENRDSFRRPERRVASYVALRTESFLDDIEPVTEEDARFRYESRPEDYTPETENDSEETDAETSPIPFEDVSEQIISDISMERAGRLAADRAADMAIRLMPARNRDPATLRDIAEEHDLEVNTAGPFRMGEMIEGFRNPFAFARAVFSLDTTPLGRVGEPLEQGDRILVFVLDDIIPPSLPELDEVRDRVVARAEEARKREVLQEKGERLVAELREAVDHGAEFTEAARERGLDIEEPVVFQPKDFRSGMPQLPPALLQNIGERSAGDIFGPVETRVGDLHIGYVQSREPRPEDTAEILPEIKNQLAYRLHTQAFEQRFTEKVLDPMIQRDTRDLAPAEEMPEAAEDL